jgi:hypothetical protein
MKCSAEQAGGPTGLNFLEVLHIVQDTVDLRLCNTICNPNDVESTSSVATMHV